jgi:hypothetical protein
MPFLFPIPISDPRGMDIAVQIAEGLEAAHANGSRNAGAREGPVRRRAQRRLLVQLRRGRNVEV